MLVGNNLLFNWLYIFCGKNGESGGGYFGDSEKAARLRRREPHALEIVIRRHAMALSKLHASRRKSDTSRTPFDDRKAKLENAVYPVVYKYDFGDGREHDIVEKKVQFLDTLREDPDSEEASAYRRWAGNDFNAELFDRRAANATLLRMAWNRWGGK